MEAFRRRLGMMARKVSGTAAASDGVVDGEEACSSNSPVPTTTTTPPHPSPEISRKYWMPDSLVNDCHNCQTKFTALRRKHHCRICSQIFCSSCSNNYIQVRCQGNVRACNYCKDAYEKQRNSEDGVDAATVAALSSSLPFSSSHQNKRGSGSIFENPVDDVDEDVPVVGSFPGASAAALRSSFGGRKAISVSSPYLAQGRSGLDEETADKNRPAAVSLKYPKKLMVLSRQMAHPVTGIPLELHRHGCKTHPSCFLGLHLVQWLQHRNSSTPKETALAIGQALIDFGHLRDVTVPKDQASSCRFCPDVPYRLAGYQPSPVEGARLLGYSFSSGASGLGSGGAFSGNLCGDSSDQLEGKEIEDVVDDNKKEEFMDVPEWFRSIITNDNDEVVVEPDEDKENFEPSVYQVSPTINRKEEEYLENLRKAQEGFEIPTDKLNVANLSCSELDEIYARHQEQYVSKLMRKEGLSSDKWKDVVRSFSAQLVAGTKANYKLTKNMDVTRQIKVKRLPGGSSDDCEIVPGEVFAGGVAMNRMPLDVDRPRLLLIRDKLNFPRDDGKLISMANLNVQMDEYVRNTVDKLMGFKPDVILAEKEVCRDVVEALLEAKVALVLRVKPKVLERLQRLFDLKIITSLDSVMLDPTPSAANGCSSYSSERLTLQQGSARRATNLVRLRSDDPGRGCTVLLRGGSSRELGKVKRVLLQTVLVAFNAKLEKSFLLTEYVQTSQYNHELYRFENLTLPEMTLTPFVSMKLPFPMDDDDDDDDDDEEEKEDVVVAKEEEEEEGEEAFPALVTAVLTSGMEDRAVRNLVADYRLRSDSKYFRKRRRAEREAEIVKDTTMPTYYRRLKAKGLPIVYSSHSPISRISPQYCVPPWVTTMLFYGALDMPIGSFLDEFCFDPEAGCANPKCVTPLRDHVRRFCMEDTCVTLNVQEVKDGMSVGGVQSAIQVWRFCTACEIVTPILPLTEDAAAYSFAMVFLMLIREDRMVRRGSTASLCKHSLHRDHHICFSKGETLASFKVSKITLLDLVVPPKVVDMPSRVPTEEKLILDLKVLSDHGSSIYSQIDEKLAKMLSADSVHNGALQSAVRQSMSEKEKDFQCYRNGLDQISNSIAKGEHLAEMSTSILMFKVSMLKSVTRWRSRLFQLSEMKKKEEKSDSEPVAATTAANAEQILVSPFSPKLHPDLYLPPGVLVDEEQPSTVIAYALASNKHQEFLNAEPTFANNGDGGASLSQKKTFLRKKSGVGDAPAHPFHFQHTFSDESSEFYCSALFAREFERLRQKVVGLPLLDLIGSLSSCRRFRASGGKSGVKFYKTSDDRFILKELSRQEADDFYVFAPKYMRYVERALESGRPTLLSKILGVYDVGYKKSPTTNGSATVLLVMENLVYGREVSWSYDLKGSLRNRLVNEERRDDDDDHQVLMDENLLKSSRKKPFYVTEKSRRLLNAAIGNDTAFLQDTYMMDYSLFVAFDGRTEELVLGIIDYVRVYTWDKQVETFIKSSGLLGGAGKTPTVVAPTVYRTRFQKAMSKYFTVVPSYWHDSCLPDDE